MIVFDFSGLPVVIDGLRPEAERVVLGLWGNFLASAFGPEWIRATVTYALSPSAPGAFDPRGMRSTGVASGRRLAMVGASAEIGRRGSVSIVVDGHDAAHDALAVVNVLHAAVAWHVQERAGMLLHAAAAVLDGRAFVLVAAAGSGKTTWAKGMAASGVHVLSDDLVLVERSAEGFVAVGTPLRAKEFGGGRPGRWPIAALLLPEHARTPVLAPAGRLRLHAAIAANLPFATDDPQRFPEIAACAAALVDGVPGLVLRFAPGDAGVSALRAWNAASGP